MLNFPRGYALVYYLSAFLGAAVLSFFLIRQKADPLPEFFTNAISLGQVERGEKATAVFRCFNRGLAPLVLESVNVPCGCMVVELPKEPIRWRQEAQITVQYDSASDQGGTFKEFEITTNSKRKPKEVLRLTANVAIEQMVSPSRIYLSTVHGRAVSTRFVIRDVGTSALEISKVQELTPWLSATVVPAEGSPGKFDGTLSISAAADVPVGKQSHFLTIELKGKSPLTIPIDLDIQSIFLVSPEKIVFGMMKPGETRSASVTLSRHDGKPFKITDVKASEGCKGVEFSTEPHAGGGVKVSGTYVSAAPGALQGEVMMVTDSDDEQSVRVPLVGYVG